MLTVFHTGSGTAEDHSESHNTNEGDGHARDPTLFRPVTHIADENGEYGRRGVRRHGQQLCLRRSITKFLDD